MVMTDNFLSDQEQECLIAQGNVAKIEQRIHKIGKAIKKLLSPNEAMIQGEKIEVTFGLDDLNPERLDEIIPEMKNLVAEYHQLKKSQQEARSRINELHNFNVFKVDVK